MHKRLMILGFLLLVLRPLAAQEHHDFAWYEQQTYAAWQAGDWPGLIALGKEALRAGYDYFYLRQRLGRAYYEQGAYRQAARHFARALTMNRNALTAEYLYYAYRFGGQLPDAALAYAWNQHLLQQRGVPSPVGLATGLYTEGGIKLTSPADPALGVLKYWHAGLRQQLGGRLSLYHAYVRVSRNLYSTTSQPPAPGPRPPATTEQAFKYSQNEYYLRAGLAVHPGWQVVGTWRYQGIRDSTAYGNVAWQAGVAAGGTTVEGRLLYGQALINNKRYDQLAGTLIWYPFGSLRLYSHTTLFWLPEGQNNRVVLYQKLGMRTTAKLWTEAYAYLGDVRNIQDMEGFYLYNLPDVMNLRLGVTFIGLAGERLRVLTGYTFERLETSASDDYYQHYLFVGMQIDFKSFTKK